MAYTATINTPGYLPMADEPAVFDTAEEAWWYLYHERIRGEDDFPCELCQGKSTHGPMGDCDDDSETATALGKAARAGVVDVVYGPTPGYDGDHDLGLAYSVNLMTLDDITEHNLACGDDLERKICVECQLLLDGNASPNTANDLATPLCADCCGED